MKRMISALIGTMWLAACAGPVETHFGGMTPVAGTASLPAVAIARDSASDGRWPAVAAALARQGVQVDEASPYQLMFAAGVRPATSGIYVQNGATVARAKKQRLLQSCADRSIRLVLTVVDMRSGDLIARGWAEESHCKASAQDVLPVLADRAAAMLRNPVSLASAKRWARD